MNKKKKIKILDVTVRVVFVYLIIYFSMPWRFASHYSYLQQEEILKSLVEQVTKNISLQQLYPCDYNDLINSNPYSYHAHYRDRILRSEEIMIGGEWFPTMMCRAKYSTAIIVPYRQREEQLNKFLIYMHNYLRQQQIHYRIFLIEQYDQKPFNRAKLFNIGSLIAAQHGFPCLILHDVDLLPLNLGQLYACSREPRHMCSALDIFRYNLPYTGLFGGVVAITTAQFRTINGLSNKYEGWGGEDDDFFERLRARGYSICRFPPSHSEYTMLKHKPETPNENRLALLRNASMRIQTDGLNTLEYEEKERRLHSLFTHILVKT